MKRTTLMLVIFAMTAWAGVTAVACLWDHDTLQMERKRFPTTLELITGKFLRHSKAFYEWRIKDRESRLNQERSSELYDDLAVAYEKTGRTDEAIRVMMDKDSSFPGLYTTHANLGTFYIHAGRLSDGIVEIDKALAINPEAHFGRELYQKRLVEYLLTLQVDKPLELPLSDQLTQGMSPIGFASFLLGDLDAAEPPEKKREMLDAATKGVLGMMKFGNHDSPILLEVLGDLLLSQGFPSDAKQLAARAYLKAAMGTKESEAKKGYILKAQSCLKFQTNGDGSNKELSFEDLLKQFKAELIDARKWYAGVIKDEKTWLDRGRNVEEAFEAKYYSEPPPVSR